MTTPLFPTGVRMVDTADILATDNGRVNSFAAGVTTGTVPALVLNGGTFVVLISAATTPGTQTSRTAVQMLTDSPAGYPGHNYILRICQSGAGTFTLAGGVGVTIVGTATIATATFRDFVVQVSGTLTAPTYTMTNIGTGTYT